MVTGFLEGRIPVLIAGVRFLGAVVLFLLDYLQSLLYLVCIIYTSTQIPFWYLVKASEYTMLGFSDKRIQIVFFILLAYLYWKERESTTANRERTVG